MESRDILTIEALKAYLHEHSLTWETAGLSAELLTRKQFPVRIPRFYADLIHWNDSEDPLRKIVIPAAAEQDIQSYELSDPIGDHTHEPVPGLVHRYPNRCLLLLTTHCSIHCRFCFRRDVIGTPLPIDLPGITSYLQNHTEIEEIIYTGGDPATIPPAFLASMIDKLAPLSHIKTWRFHTRTMVVDPEYVKEAWYEQLDRLNQVQKVVVLHVDHAREVTLELKHLVQTLQRHHIQVLSQSVLLKGVNDSLDALHQLFTSLSSAGIKPYYLHHLDKAQRTHHFRISIEAGKKLYTQLRGKISGYAIPEYVVDLPGGDGKVPVMWMRKISPDTYEVENFQGKTITYIDPLGGPS